MRELVYPRLLLATAQRSAGDRALISEDGVDRSFGDHVVRVQQLVAGMRKRLDLTPGDRFGVMAANSIRHIELWHAALFGGGVINPLNLRFSGPYWQRPEETEAAFRGGWYHTGDVGYLDEDGYLFLVDRLKDMIVTGGENVYCTEVENAIGDHPAVAQVAVIGIPDPQWVKLCMRSSCFTPGPKRPKNNCVTTLAHWLPVTKCLRRLNSGQTPYLCRAL